MHIAGLRGEKNASASSTYLQPFAAQLHHWVELLVRRGVAEAGDSLQRGQQECEGVVTLSRRKKVVYS